MRKIINYIRSCFCKHDWEQLDKAHMYGMINQKLPIGTKWTYRCKKCGYFYTYKDYEDYGKR